MIARKLAESDCVASQQPRYGATVLRIDDYRPDAGFKDRVAELIAGRPLSEIQDKTGIHPNQLTQLLKGRVVLPSYNTLRKLASLQDWATAAWVATGEFEWQEDERNLDTVEALHAWDLKQAKKRMLFFERIIKKQQAAMAREIVSGAPSPEARRIWEEARADSAARADQAIPGTPSHRHPGTEPLAS